MNKNRGKVVSLQEYKEKKKQLQTDRDELLNLIKRIVTIK